MNAKPFKAPPLTLDQPDVTAIERLTVKKLRTESGWYAGDAAALAAIREHAAFSVARFQFSGPTQSDSANAGHLKPAGEVAGRKQS